MRRPDLKLARQLRNVIRQDRRVVVGLDSSGRSTVREDGRSLPTIELPNGIVRQEIWAQSQVPARSGDDGTRGGPLDPAPPDRGVVVRMLTVPPMMGVGSGPDLHFDDAVHVITLVEGVLDIVLETETVRLQQADTIVLPASVHDLRNESSTPATFVYTSVRRER